MLHGFSFFPISLRRPRAGPLAARENRPLARLPPRHQRSERRFSNSQRRARSIVRDEKFLARYGGFAKAGRRSVELQRLPEAKVTERVSIDDYSTWRAVWTGRKGTFRPYQLSEPQPRGAVTGRAVAQRRSRASGLTRPLAEAIRGFDSGFGVGFVVGSLAVPLRFAVSLLFSVLYL